MPDIPLNPNEWLDAIKKSKTTDKGSLDFAEASRLLAEATQKNLAKPSEVVSPSRFSAWASGGVGRLVADSGPQPMGDGTIAAPFNPAVNEEGALGDAAKDLYIEPGARLAVDEAQRRGIKTVSSGFDKARGVGWAIGKDKDGRTVRVEMTPDDTGTDFESFLNPKQKPAPMPSSVAATPDDKPAPAPLPPSIPPAPKPPQDNKPSSFEDELMRPAPAMETEAAPTAPMDAEAPSSFGFSAPPTPPPPEPLKEEDKRKILDRLKLTPDADTSWDKLREKYGAAGGSAMRDFVDSLTPGSRSGMAPSAGTPEANRKRLKDLGIPDEVINRWEAGAKGNLTQFNADKFETQWKKLFPWAKNATDVQKINDFIDVQEAKAVHEANAPLLKAQGIVDADDPKAFDANPGYARQYLAGVKEEDRRKWAEKSTLRTIQGWVDPVARSFLFGLASPTDLAYRLGGKTEEERKSISDEMHRAMSEAPGFVQLSGEVAHLATALIPIRGLSAAAEAGAARTILRVSGAAKLTAEGAATAKYIGSLSGMTIYSALSAEGDLGERAIAGLSGLEWALFAGYAGRNIRSVLKTWGPRKQNAFTEYMSAFLATAATSDTPLDQVAIQSVGFGILGAMTGHPNYTKAAYDIGGKLKGFDVAKEVAALGVKAEPAEAPKEAKATEAPAAGSTPTATEPVAAPKKAAAPGTEPVQLSDVRTYEQVEAAIVREQARATTIENEVLGDRADAWRKAHRQMNSSDKEVSEKGERKIQEIERDLDPTEIDRLYGVGEQGLSAEDLRHIRDEMSSMHDVDPGSLAKRLEHRLSKWDGKNPTEELILRYGFDQAEKAGIDRRELADAILKRIADKHADPEDAAFIAERISAIAQGKDLGSGVEGMVSEAPEPGRPELPETTTKGGITVVKRPFEDPPAERVVSDEAPSRPPASGSPAQDPISAWLERRGFNPAEFTGDRRKAAEETYNKNLTPRQQEIALNGIRASFAAAPEAPTPIQRAVRNPDAPTRSPETTAHLDALDSLMSGTPPAAPPAPPEPPVPPNGKKPSGKNPSSWDTPFGRGVNLAHRLLDVLTNRALPITTRTNRAAAEAGARALAAPGAVDPWLIWVKRHVLGDGALNEREFGTALSEDNLRSVRKQKQKAADSAKQISPDLGREAQAAADAVYSHIGETDGPFRTEADYQAYLGRQDVRDAIGRHVEMFERYIDPHYRVLQDIREGADLPTRGEQTQARINLRRLEGMPDSRTTKQGNPRNLEQRDSPMARTATGAADAGYEGNYIEQMRNSMGRQAYDSYKKQYVTHLIEGKDAINPTPGQKDITIKGEPVEIYTITKDMVIQKSDGEGVFKPGERIAVRKSLDPEFRQVFKMDKMDPLASVPEVKKFIQGVTQASLDLTLADNFVNTVNAISTVFSRPGTSGLPVNAETALGFVGLDKPVVAWRLGEQFVRLIGNSPEVRREIADLAAIGAWRPRSSGKGWNPLTNKETGGWNWDLSRREGTSTATHLGSMAWRVPFEAWKVATTPPRRFTERLSEAARLSLDRAWKKMAASHPEIAALGEAGRRDFVNQVGNYVKGSTNQLLEPIRDLGANPLLTAAKTRLSNAGTTATGFITGRPGIDVPLDSRAAMEFRANMASKWVGMAVTVGVWNYFHTSDDDGNWAQRAMGRKGVPFGALDLGGNNPETGRPRYFDIIEWTGLRRPLKYFGIDRTIDVRRAGVSWEESNFAVGDVGPSNALWGLFAGGPIPQFIKTASTGSNIYGYRVAEPGSTAKQTVINNLDAAMQQLIAVWDPIKATPLFRPLAETLGLPVKGSFGEALKEAKDSMTQIIREKEGKTEKQVDNTSETFVWSHALKYLDYIQHEMMKQPKAERVKWAHTKIMEFTKDLPQQYRGHIREKLLRKVDSAATFR